MIDDPLFLAVAIPAVVLTGIAKSGFGGVALLAVPLMALAIPPLQAAGIMLPLLLAMDALAVWTWRGTWDWKILGIVLPGAVVGITLGGFLAGSVNPAFIILGVGLIGMIYAVYSFRLFRSGKPGKPASRPEGVFWGGVAGFTSFAAHAGGPPLQAYLLPQQLDKSVYAGTSVLFFAVVNIVKLVPYAILGQLSAPNMITALWLSPLVPIGIFLGLWLNRRLSQERFNLVVYFFTFLASAKLAWDGVAGLL